MDSSHWQAQYERWGILTNGYRKAKRAAYQRVRTLTLIERKRRELARAEDDCPIGRIRHLWAQVNRMENLHV